VAYSESSSTVGEPVMKSQLKSLAKKLKKYEMAHAKLLTMASSNEQGVPTSLLGNVAKGNRTTGTTSGTTKMRNGSSGGGQTAVENVGPSISQKYKK